MNDDRVPLDDAGRARLREAAGLAAACASDYAYLDPSAAALRLAADVLRYVAHDQPVHWYVQPRYSRPPSFCITHVEDADAAEWHEKEHGHTVTPLYAAPTLPKEGA